MVVCGLLAAISIGKQDRYRILEEFERGRSHLLFAFTIKLQHWEEPPWSLYAVAHQDSEVAVAAMNRNLASDSNHPRVAALRQEPLIDQVHAFCEEPLSVFNEEAEFLPELRKVLVQHRVAFSAERLIEGKHAIAQKGIRCAPSHTTPLTSLLHRTREIKQELQDNPETLDVLANQLARVRSPRVAVELLGLQHHPSCQLARNGRDPIYTQVIYHADPWTKYTSTAPPIEVDKPGDRPMAARVHQPGSSKALFHNLAVRRLEAYFGDEGNINGFYSIPFKPGCFKSLQSLLSSRPDATDGFARPAGGDIGAASSDCAPLATGELLHWPTHAQAGTDAETEVAFWRVVSAVGAFRAVRTKVAGEETLKHKVVVSLHSVLKLDLANERVVVHSTPFQVPTVAGKPGAMTFIPTALPLDDLSKIHAWEADECALRYTFSDHYLSTLPGDVCSGVPVLLGRLMKNPQGYAVLGQDGDDRIRAAPPRLHDDGMVEGPPWKLTTKGIACTLIGHALSEPMPVLRRWPHDLRHASDYQLLSELEHRGWEHRVVDNEGYKAAKLTFQIAADDHCSKTWFTRDPDITVFRTYLLALLLATAHGKPVPHLQNESVYAQLLGLQPKHAPCTRRARMGMS